jgi:hypothetical protein
MGNKTGLEHRTLEELLRVLRVDAWEKGKEQRKAPQDYTLHDETLLKSVWQEITNRYLPRKQVEAAVNTGQFIDPSKTSGELIEAFRRQISSKLGLTQDHPTPNPTKPFKKGGPL